MRKSTLHILLVCLFCFVFSFIHGEEDIIVHLHLSEPKVPLYLGPFIGKHTLTQSYLEELQSILNFDLEQTAKITVYSKQETKDKLFFQDDFKRVFASDLWRDLKVKYVLLPKIEEGNLSLMVYHVEFNHIQHYKNIPLAGNLSSDRKQLHKLADSLHQYFFNQPGIASTKILYTLQLPNAESKERNFSSEIWECDYDGKNTKRLTPSDQYCITPIFFPPKDHHAPSQFLYVSYEKGPSKIFISPLGEFSPKQLIDLRGNQLLPTLTRDRSKIAFISDAGGRADLFLQAIHPDRGLLGKPIQVFSFPASVQASPTFSPDGSQIAFVSDKDGTPRIYLIETPHLSKSLKLPKAHCISLKNKENICPNWSPDGRKLAYSAKTDGVRQVWIYDFESREEKQLTTGSEHKENPSWAPDNQHLVFNTVGSTSELYVINLLQPTMIKISSGPGKKHYPAWQP